MSPKPHLSSEQLAELRAQLMHLRADVETQMQDNLADMRPPSDDEGATVQRNVQREVRQRLTDADAQDLQRIELALEAMDDGEYGLCLSCGKAIPIERLRIEPQTQHCVACKSRAEAAQPH